MFIFILSFFHMKNFLSIQGKHKWPEKEHKSKLFFPSTDYQLWFNKFNIYKTKLKFKKYHINIYCIFIIMLLDYGHSHVFLFPGQSLCLTNLAGLSSNR